MPELYQLGHSKAKSWIDYVHIRRAWKELKVTAIIRS